MNSCTKLTMVDHRICHVTICRHIHTPSITAMQVHVVVVELCLIISI